MVKHSYTYKWPTNRKLYDLSNGDTVNDLERPLLSVSRSRHFLTLNIPETVLDRLTYILSIGY